MDVESGTAGGGIELEQNLFPFPTPPHKKSPYQRDSVRKVLNS
jgi:hypothetical protein